jgi:hypothetical protein
MIRGLPLGRPPAQPPEPARRAPNADFGTAVGLTPLAAPAAPVPADVASPCVSTSSGAGAGASAVAGVTGGAMLNREAGGGPLATHPAALLTTACSRSASDEATVDAQPAPRAPTQPTTLLRAMPEAVAAPVEARVAVAGVLVETFDLPWTLAATGHLAWQGAASTNVEMLDTRTKPAMDATDAPIGGDARVSALANPTTTSSRVSMPATAWAAAISPRSALAAAEKAEAPERPLSGSAPTEWQQRLLRCIERFDLVTVFVRDYRLDDAAADGLTQRLLDAANGEGRVPARVVINGRTTWERQERGHGYAG